MTQEIETIIKTEHGTRLSISDWDDGAWLHLQARGSTMGVVLTRDEAQQLLAGLQAILATAIESDEDRADKDEYPDEVAA